MSNVGINYATIRAKKGAAKFIGVVDRQGGARKSRKKLSVEAGISWNLQPACHSDPNNPVTTTTACRNSIVFTWKGRGGTTLVRTGGNDATFVTSKGK